MQLQTIYSSHMVAHTLQRSQPSLSVVWPRFQKKLFFVTRIAIKLPCEIENKKHG